MNEDVIGKEQLKVYIETQMRELDTRIFSVDDKLNKRVITIKDGLIFKRQVFESIYSYLDGLQNSIDFERLNDKINDDTKKLVKSLEI